LATNRVNLTYRKLEELHGIRQRNIIERVDKNAPFYRKKLEELGITPSEITKSEDVEKLPSQEKPTYVATFLSAS